jgi:hypothetical protein
MMFFEFAAWVRADLRGDISNDSKARQRWQGMHNEPWTSICEQDLQI